jgi:hypothetical protein
VNAILAKEGKSTSRSPAQKPTPNGLPEPPIYYFPHHSTHHPRDTNTSSLDSPLPILLSSLATHHQYPNWNLTHTFKMPSPSSTHTTSHTNSPRYYLITNISPNTLLSSPTEHEIDLHAESWKLPYSIDDSDLMFDGKPLNMLYEENRWMAEHVSDCGEEKARRSGKDDKSRGRSRQSKH